MKITLLCITVFLIGISIGKDLKTALGSDNCIPYRNDAQQYNQYGREAN